ncbi:glycosyltransferase family 2 protein [Sutcliffiella horikoshii]|uniref:glycosyltransferase family 2 protein n=1 Tax=Sutcliffiella horikoshii TaxID=79883 RepID=UPI00203CB0F4|nr:glycosyltransferase family 2 protein [Sutcliffiella horikoshii]MCM3617923.1 glycosyltransferase family 2 protein [Sutcliffiella horikoshii]
MEKDLVSVIIPFYNKIEWLCEAVDSVLSQSYPNVEIVVINDGSTEDMSVFTEKYSDQIIYKYQENRGAAAARNVGIEICTGEYVAFLDADDLWYPDKLETQIYLMKKNNAYWSHSSYVTFNKEKKLDKIIEVSNYGGDVFPITIISNPIATPCVVAKSEIFKGNDNFRFDETMTYGEDTILWLKISMLYTLLAIDKTLVKVRIRGSNAALSAYAQLKARAEIWGKIKSEKIFEYNRVLSINARLAFRYCSFFYRIIEHCEKKLNKSSIEFVTKVVYFVPWLTFKSEKKKYDFVRSIRRSA